MATGASAFRPCAGQWVKAAFTICSPKRYGVGMVIVVSLALAAAALSVPLERVEPQAAGPMRQAQAVVTILPGAALRFAQIERERPRVLRETAVRRPDGSVEQVRLVEFE